MTRKTNSAPTAQKKLKPAILHVNLRLTHAERDAIKRAAKKERRSMHSFVLTATMAAVRKADTEDAA